MTVIDLSRKGPVRQLLGADETTVRAWLPSGLTSVLPNRPCHSVAVHGDSYFVVASFDPLGACESIEFSRPADSDDDFVFEGISLFSRPAGSVLLDLAMHGPDLYISEGGTLITLPDVALGLWRNPQSDNEANAWSDVIEAALVAEPGYYPGVPPARSVPGAGSDPA